ncbi:MAG: glycosyltransferase family 2 protein [Parcubacteria group bacterium]
MNTGKLSIVVCTFNRAKLLESCLESLKNQTLDKSRYEVIVVDNNSTDNTRELLAKYLNECSQFRYVREYLQGLSHARNLGYRESVGDFVAYIDDDAIADAQWADKILKVFSTVSPTPAAVGGIILPYYLSAKPEWFLDEYEIRSHGDVARFLTPPGIYLCGSNFCIPKKLLEQCGGFSSDFGMVGEKMALGEETHLLHRLYGLKPFFWYDPALLVYHFVPDRNMRVWYRLKRLYASSLVSVQIKKTTPGPRAILNSLRNIWRRETNGAITNSKQRIHWQQVVLLLSTPLAYMAGGSLAIVKLFPHKFRSHFEK